MKKALLTKLMLLLCALIAGGSSVWADNQVTFSYADYKGNGTSGSGSSYTLDKTDVDITNTKFYCGSDATYAQFYASGTTTITPVSGVTITKIVLTTTANYNGFQSSGTFTASTGTVANTNSTTATWTGSATAAFTLTSNKQIRWTSIVVTYTGGQGETQTCSTPTFNIAAGAVLSGTEISLATATTDATIHYTTDGSTPTSSSTTYSSAIAIDAAKTIKAIAVKDGYNNSEVASAAYTILAAPTPNATNVGSNYYTLVEDANDLADGDAILIVSGLKAMGTTQNSNNRASVDVTIANDAIENPTGAQKLVLVKSGDYYFFYTGEGYLYAASSSANYLRTEATADQNAASTISINASKEATITFKGANTRNYIRFNSPNFACYATGSTTGAVVNIYKEVVKPAGAKSAAEFSFPKSTYYIAKDVETFTAPTVSTAAAYDGTVTYASSATDVAEVNSSTGAVTIKAAGTTVITASAEATANFYEDQASYTLKVYEIEDGVFDFAKGDYRSGAVPGTANNLTTKTTWTAGNVTMAVAGRNIWYNAGDLRLYSNNATASDNNAGNITFSTSGNNYITKIILAGGNSLSLTNGGGTKPDNNNTWTGKSQSVTFTHTGENGTITLTKITVYYSEPTISVTMGSEGYMTYCNVGAALSFGDLEAYVVSAVSTNSATLTQITQAPANTPVILKGSAGSHSLTVLESASAVGTNKLYRSNGTAENTDSRNVYALAKKGDPAVVGFYKLQDGVKVPEGKCYSAPEFLGFDFNGETTGINEVRGKMEDVSGKVYNLAGQRVAQPTKGLYIVNGKKVVIK